MRRLADTVRSRWRPAAIALLLFLTACLAVVALAGAAPRVIVISLDGTTPALVQEYLDNGAQSHEGLDLLKSVGLRAERNLTVPPPLTAPAHIAHTTGSSAPRNDIPANAFHLVASPFALTISGFSAPIGGYSIDGPAHTDAVTAEPLWLALRRAGKTVVTATFPGGDGLDIRVPGVPASPIVQPAAERTVDYTVPFGAFAGVGAVGFSLTAADFGPASAATTAQLAAAGKVSFSPVLEKTTALETFTVGGVAYQIRVAALDTTDDGLVNYDTLVFFDATNGITAGPFTLPSTGPAYVRADGTSSPFFLEGSANKAGMSFYVTRLAPDLSTVRLAHSAANAIPRNAAVLADVDDVNTHVGFWAAQADFRIPERLSPGFDPFPDVELEVIYEDQVRSFVDYQTRLALHAISRRPDVDLLMVYVEQPDGSEHQFLLTDPRQASDPRNPASIGGGQDPAKVARYRGYLQTAYQAANRAVQRIIDAVGTDRHGAPHSNVFVVSDHGFAPFHTAVNMTSFLASRGFDPAKVRAITSGPAANIYINLQGREPNGTVTPGEYVTLQQQLVAALTEFGDTNPVYAAGQARVPVFDKVFARPVPADLGDPSFGRGTSEVIGQDSGDVFAMLTVGYNFDGTQTPAVIRSGDPAATPVILSVPNFYGAHGYDPALPAMSAIFFAAGPDIRHGRLTTAHNIDVAPTVGRLLGVRLSDLVQGRALPVRVPREVLAGIRERLDDLRPTGDKKVDERIEDAVRDLGRSLHGGLWRDDSHLSRRGEEVFDQTRKAVRELARVTPTHAGVQRIVDDIVAVDEELAAIVIDETSATGATRRPDKARREFEDALAHAKAGDAAQAIKGFERAWRIAEEPGRHVTHQGGDR